MKSDDLQSALINLIDNKKSSFHGIAGLVKRDYDLFLQAREVSSWSEIVAALGFQNKESAFALAFWRESRRRAKKNGGIEAPQAKPVPDPVQGELLKKEPVQNETKKTESTKTFSTISTREAGITTPLGRGKFQINRETSDDKL